MYTDILTLWSDQPGLSLAIWLLLGLWAQWRVKSTFAKASQQAASLSGAAAARHLLDEAGLQSVGIEQIPGHLSDHYDPRAKVLRLSQGVYGSRSLAAVESASRYWWSGKTWVTISSTGAPVSSSMSCVIWNVCSVPPRRASSP